MTYLWADDPPRVEAEPEAVAPERYREAGYCLTRTQRDSAVNGLLASGDAATGSEAWGIVRAYVLARDAARTARETFSEWWPKRRARLRACDPRRDGWRQR